MCVFVVVFPLTNNGDDFNNDNDDDENDNDDYEEDDDKNKNGTYLHYTRQIMMMICFLQLLELSLS